MALAVALGVSLSMSAPRDPQTMYNVYLANLKSLDPAICNDNIGSAIMRSPAVYLEVSEVWAPAAGAGPCGGRP